MFNLYDKDKIRIGSFATIKEAKVAMIDAYCRNEIPRLAQIIEINDLIAMIKQDKMTAFNDGYIEDFMTIKEEG